MEGFVTFASPLYIACTAALAAARGMDFLSTYIATPNLVLEANPIARWLGWKAGIIVNLVVVLLLGMWPLPAIVFTTTSFLVAARNLQGAWMMRAMGEHRYRAWISECLEATPRALFAFCLFMQCFLVALVGAALLWLAPDRLVAVGVGAGMISYAVAVLVFTCLSTWRFWRRGA